MPYILVTHGDNYCQQHYSPACSLQKQMDPLKPEARAWATDNLPGLLLRLIYEDFRLKGSENPL